MVPLSLLEALADKTGFRHECCQKNEKNWVEMDADKCPQCGESETMAHVLKRKDPDDIQIFNNSVEKLLAWMGQARTDPDIQQGVKLALKAWKTGR